jgi:hypothetical protein
VTFGLSVAGDAATEATRTTDRRIVELINFTVYTTGLPPPPLQLKH